MQLDRYLLDTRDRYSVHMSTPGPGGDWRVFISLGLTSRRGTKSISQCNGECGGGGGGEGNGRSFE